MGHLSGVLTTIFPYSQLTLCLAYFYSNSKHNKRSFHEQYSPYTTVRNLCLKIDPTLRITVTDVDIVDGEVILLMMNCFI